VVGAFNLLGGGTIVTIYNVRIGLSLTRMEDDDDDLDVFTDKLMDELIALNDEADLGGSATSGLFEVGVVIEAHGPLEALQLGTVQVKAAAHAAGGHTVKLEVPETWPGWIHEVSLAAEPIVSDPEPALA